MSGPGSELHNILSYFVRTTSGCGCVDKVKIMNDWGPDLCEANRTIILSWLRKSARERGLPFFEPLANLAISRAIKKSRENK